MCAGKGKIKGVPGEGGVGSVPTCHAPVLHKCCSMKFHVSC